MVSEPIDRGVHERARLRCMAKFSVITKDGVQNGLSKASSSGNKYGLGQTGTCGSIL